MVRMAAIACATLAAAAASHAVPTTYTDPAALLARCAGAAPRLLCTYRLAGEETVSERRARGWFTDYGEAEFRALLEAAGWRIEAAEQGAGTTLFVCARD